MTETQYAGELLNCRPSEATAEVLAAWVQGMSKWPLAKIRKHQRINRAQQVLIHGRADKETARANLQAMEDVYRRAVGLKCFGSVDGDRLTVDGDRWTYEFPLRPGVMATIRNIPCDLRAIEVDQITKFLKTLVAE